MTPDGEYNGATANGSVGSAVGGEGPVVTFAGELVASFDALKGKPEDWLLAQGVDRIALMAWPGPVGVMSIEVAGKSGLYQPAEEDGGQAAFIQPVHEDGPYSDIIDLVAWRPTDPGTLWLRTGAGEMLGGASLRLGHAWRQPLRVHRTPLGWLAAGGVGAVIFDWKCPPLKLFDLTGFDAEDFAHGEQIERALVRPAPPKPRIRFPAPREAAA